MRKLLMHAARALALCLPLVLGIPTAQAALSVGSQAPEIAATAALAGQAFHWTLSEARRKGPVVVYFYPSAFTKGCNLQAHTFATQLEKFQAAGASVIGVSLDSIDRLKRFSADPQYCAGKLPVASDADGQIARSYQLEIRDTPAGRKDTQGEEIGHGLVERTTFVLSPDGHIIATIAGLAADANVAEALATVEKYAAGH